MQEYKTTVGGQPFLGRVEEQDKFRNALNTIKSQRKIFTKVTDWVDEKQTPFPFVFLLYGEGGMGKTYLSKRFREIVENEPDNKGHFSALWLDWERRRDLDYGLKARDSILPEKVFEHIYAIFRDAKLGKKFTEYKQTISTRAKAEKKVSEALDKTTERGERYKILRELGGKGIAWLIRSGIVSGVSIPLPEEPTAKLFENIIGGGAEEIARVRESANSLLSSTLDEKEIDLFTSPNEKLAHSLAEGIRETASDKSIVLFLDTYEIPDRVDVWIREVIKRSGINIVWVISGRDNLAVSRKFGTSYFTGYKDDFPSKYLRVFPLSEFSPNEVLTYLTESVPDRIANIDVAEAIHRATQGIPLAVQAATSMWKTKIELNEIVENIPENSHRDEIVKLMTERFLLHCFDDPAHPDDLYQIYALALAYQPNPELLQSILQCDDLEKTLSELERRYSFVFLDKMKLHSSVQAFLREYLLQDLHRTSKNVKNIHQRAADYLNKGCSNIEAKTPLLENLIENDLWKEKKLGLINHTFWLDLDAGWTVLVAPFVTGLIYDKNYSRACVEILNNISKTFKKPMKERLRVMKRGIQEYADKRQNASMLERLDKVFNKNHDIAFESEIRAYISILHGKSLFSRTKYPEALDAFDESEIYLSDENTKTQDLLGSLLLVLANNLLISNPTFNDMWFRMKLVSIIKKGIKYAIHDKSRGYGLLGSAFYNVGNYDDATIAYEKAIELNENHVEPYMGLAMISRDKRNIDDAITLCKKAIEINPKYKNAQNGLGYLYNQKGNYDLAEKHLVIALNAKYNISKECINLGIIKLYKEDPIEADKLFSRAITNDEDYFGPSGWAKVIIGEIESGLSDIKNALNRQNYLADVQDIFDWSLLASNVPNPPKGTKHLLDFIKSEPIFIKHLKSDYLQFFDN